MTLGSAFALGSGFALGSEVALGAILLVTLAIVLALARRAGDEAAGLRRDVGRFSELWPALSELRALMATTPHKPSRTPVPRHRSLR